jgi:hypothetical protein
LLLDVIAVLGLAVGSVVLIVYMTLRAVLAKTCGDGRHKEDVKILRKKKRNKARFQALAVANFFVEVCC